MPWYDRYGAIAGTTIYCDGTLVGRDCSVTLPSAARPTAEINAGGPIDLPISGQYEQMELTITKIGVAHDIAILCSPVAHEIEIRAVEDSIGSDGQKRIHQLKFFLTAIPKDVPEMQLEFGEIPENEISFEALTYKAFDNGQKMWDINKLVPKDEINGVDYADYIESYL